MEASAATYIIAQWLFLKLLGVVYACAFGSLLLQVEGLYGCRGILPLKDYSGPLNRREKIRLLRRRPSLLLFGHRDRTLRLGAVAGLVLALLLIGGLCPTLCLVLLWILYLSYVNLGQEFLAFQWDSLMLETGFMAIFFTLASPPPLLAVLAWWLFLFRFILSSGVVKLTSGDPCWRDLSALGYHYLTQPLPNRVAWYASQLPPVLQKLSTLGVFFFELAVPCFIWGPPALRQTAFGLMVLFQCLILLTGSYGFFNLLTIALAVPLLGDYSLAWLAPLVLPPAPAGVLPTLLVNGVFALVVFINLLQLVLLFRRRVWLQRWLYPLSRWGISSSYGLFAVMTTCRYEYVLEGSRDQQTWQAYEFRWKPGDPARSPRYAVPHQPRLDWQMWFAALQPEVLEPWLANLVTRLLQGSKPVLALLRNNPFGEQPPRYIRLVVYRYRFSDRATRAATGNWWRREAVGESQAFSL